MADLPEGLRHHRRSRAAPSPCRWPTSSTSAEEKARLEKTLGKLAKEIGGLRGRLNNPKFAESAPEEVVDEARDNLAAREDEAGKLREALARLAEIG